MPNYKKGRSAEDIKRELTAIIRELKDPRISDAMLTVVHTELAGDLSYGKVFISSLNGIEAAKAACKCLEPAGGFIRRELADRLHLRKPPELKFIPDYSVERSIEMFEKLNRNGKDSDLENEN